MKTLIDGIPESLVILIENLRTQLCDPAFKERHRSHAKAFTRRRLLTFPVVMLLVLQKTARSVQRHLHEFFQMLALEFHDQLAGEESKAGQIIFRVGEDRKVTIEIRYFVPIGPTRQVVVNLHAPGRKYR